MSESISARFEAAKNEIIAVINRYHRELGKSTEIGPALSNTAESGHLLNRGINRKHYIDLALNAIKSEIFEISQRGNIYKTQFNPTYDEAFFGKILKTGFGPELHQLGAKRLSGFPAFTIDDLLKLPRWSQFLEETQSARFRRLSPVYAREQYNNGVKLYCFYRALFNGFVMAVTTSLKENPKPIEHEDRAVEALEAGRAYLCKCQAKFGLQLT